MKVGAHRLDSETFFYGLGTVKLGLPFSATRALCDGFDAARRARRYSKHKALGRALLKAHPESRGIIDSTRGSAPIDARVQGLIPGFADMVARAQQIVAAEGAALDPEPGEPYGNLLTDAAIERNPIFFDVASQPSLVAMVADYLGTAPQLRNISILLSKPRDGLFSSMRYHLDRMDTGMVGLWINLIDMTPENGPFTFVPADQSEQVCASLDYYRTSWTGQTRVEDSDIERIVGADACTPVAGPAGTGHWFVDTSRCLHMGGRCRTGMRAALHIRYCLPHKIGPTYRDRFVAQAGDDPLRRALLLLD
jgi:hypothetical protein